MLPSGALSLIVVAMGAFPLAMIWSLAYRYVEGRRCSDAVGGVYGTSVILGPGISKLAGSALATVCDAFRISEWAVPFIATAFFFLPGYILCVNGLNKTPSPTEAEIAENGDRSATIGGISAAGGSSFSICCGCTGLGCSASASTTDACSPFAKFATRFSQRSGALSMATCRHPRRSSLPKSRRRSWCYIFANA